MPQTNDDPMRKECRPAEVCLFSDMSSKIEVLKKLVFDKNYRSRFLAMKGIWEPISDEEFLRRKFRSSMGVELNLDHPETFNEKLQWLKLYDRRPEYTQMVDKLAAKEWVASRIGEEYVLPVLGVWDSAEDVDFQSLPDKFVLKCTHDSGGLVICKDKSALDVEAAREKLRRSLRRNYYVVHREWPYKNVQKKIFAEPYIEDEKYGELRDYKFFTFAGEPKVLYIAQGRGSGGETFADFFDMKFCHLPFRIDHEMAPNSPEAPENFEKMKELAAKLSQGTPELRVDFYEVNGQIIFGELTFFHCSGFHPFSPKEWDKTLGDWITLPPKRTGKKTED